MVRRGRAGDHLTARCSGSTTAFRRPCPSNDVRGSAAARPSVEAVQISPLPVRFPVLGPVRAWRGARELSLGPPQSRTLLALLLAHGGEVMSLPRIVDA